MERLRIGIVGMGKISGIYLKNLTGIFGRRVAVRAVTDIIRERVESAARDYHISHIMRDVEELIHSDEVDIVLNLTPPKVHYDVAIRAVKGGKHIYNEKPLCAKWEEGVELLAAARAGKVRVGGAPDTFLGAGIRTCRKLIDDGWIGRPIAAVAFMLGHGPEDWHPDPEFFYKGGGGPLFDMGPYYLTALVNLLGPVSRVSGSAQRGFATRTVTSEAQNGKVIDVEVPTHVAGVLDFASGAVGTLITSFDVWSHTLPNLEIYGTEGTLRVPDPNTFGGPVLVRRGRAENWSEIPLLWQDFSGNSRGLGITDMAEAIVEGRPHRASGELSCHVLEIMQGLHHASASGTCYRLTSACSQPDPL